MPSTACGQAGVKGDLTNHGRAWVWLDPIFERINWHREKYAEMEKAEVDYDTDPDEKEEGPLEDRLHEAGDCARGVFGI
jgi:hypothetical protein